jgi:hypothetical protein
MAKKVAKVGVKKEGGYLYFVDKQGDVSRAKMARGSSKGGKAQKVAKVGVKKESGFDVRSYRVLRRDLPADDRHDVVGRVDRRSDDRSDRRGARVLIASR